MSSGPDPNPVNAALPWGTDFQLTPNGSIVMIGGLERLRERIIRRIFTNPREVLPNGFTVNADYPFDQNYGVGAQRAVGQMTKKDFLQKMRAKIRKGVMIDEGVDATAPPVTTFSQVGPTFYASVSITLLDGTPTTLNFPVGQ